MQDICIEGAQIICHKVLIEIAERTPSLDRDLFVRPLKHNLDEEIIIQKWCLIIYP